MKISTPPGTIEAIAVALLNSLLSCFIIYIDRKYRYTYIIIVIIMINRNESAKGRGGKKQTGMNTSRKEGTGLDASTPKIYLQKDLYQGI